MARQKQEDGMTDVKHTPGPWGFGNTNEDRRMILGDGGNGRYVCTVQIYQTPRHMGLLYEAEREANARLILSAPDLLAALKECAKLLSGLVPIETDKAIRREITEHRDLARAAIEKAERKP